MMLVLRVPAVLEYSQDLHAEESTIAQVGNMSHAGILERSRK